MSVDVNNPEKYMGTFVQTYLGYASDPGIRNGAGSGGVTSAILIYLLEKGIVDGVLVSRTGVEDGKVVAESYIATTREEVLDSRQSIYMDFNYSKNLRSILEFPGTIAMVGLPCHFEILQTLMVKHPSLNDKIKFKISLFCSGVPKQNMLSEVLANKGIDQSQVQRFYFRQGHWRGYMKAVMNDGTTNEFKYIDNYGVYKNSYFDMLPRCSTCRNHFGYDADISVGDAWLREMKKHPIKHNLFFTKNEDADRLIQQMIEDGYLTADTTDYKNVLRAQKRPLIYKFYSSKARKQTAKIFGYDLKFDTPDKSKINHYIAGFIIAFNMKMCDFKWTRKLIYKIPKKLMFLYMGLIRVLLSR
jgi:coenzyme F420-reducing hydrogenase beta subunit